MKVFSLQAPIYRGASLSSRPDGADLTTRSRQARRARTLAARPLARAFGRGGGPRRRGEPGLALPLGEAARAALAEAAPGASGDLGQRPHAADPAGARWYTHAGQAQTRR